MIFAAQGPERSATESGLERMHKEFVLVVPTITDARCPCLRNHPVDDLRRSRMRREKLLLNLGS